MGPGLITVIRTSSHWSGSYTIINHMPLLKLRFPSLNPLESNLEDGRCYEVYAWQRLIAICRLEQLMGGATFHPNLPEAHI